MWIFLFCSWLWGCERVLLSNKHACSVLSTLQQYIKQKVLVTVSRSKYNTIKCLSQTFKKYLYDKLANIIKTDKNIKQYIYL